LIDDAVQVFVDSPNTATECRRAGHQSPKIAVCWISSKTLYKNVLDRDTENQEVINHHTKAVCDLRLPTAIAGFFNSPEYHTKNLSINETVKKLYRSILGRELNPGIRIPIHEISRGRSIDGAVQAFVDSPVSATTKVFP